MEMIEGAGGGRGERGSGEGKRFIALSPQLDDFLSLSAISGKVLMKVDL